MDDSLPGNALESELATLRTEARRNKLALRVQQQRAQLRAGGQLAHLSAVESRGALESNSLESSFNYWDPSNFVNLMDYVGNGPYGYSLVNSPWLSTRADRDLGRNRPIYQTEMDLMAYRGMARLLTAYNANAIGAVENLTSYVVGEGAKYHASPAKGCADSAPAACVQKCIDAFVERNEWDIDFAEEKFQRSRVDGEYYVGLWHVGDGVVDARIIEPEQITQPYSHREIEEWMGCDHHPVDWTFGVCADDEDSQTVHGYYVQWTNRDTDWDFLPGGNAPFYPPGTSNSWCEHFKVNVTRNMKRGLTDFLCLQELLNLARKVMLNMGNATSISAAIAWIIEHAPGILTSQIQSMVQANAMSSYTQGMSSAAGGNSRVNYVQQYNGGTILHTKESQQYKNAPGADNAPNYINVVGAMLRSCAVRWSMPEHMITGDASNNDYASILEAGSPFEKRASRGQRRYGQSDKRVLWKVVKWACEAGRVRNAAGVPIDFATCRRMVNLEVIFPRVAVRDEDAIEATYERRKRNGVMSRKTWASKVDLDFDQQVKEGAQDEVGEEAEQGKKNPGSVSGEGDPAGSGSDVERGEPPVGAVQHATESLDDLEAFDESKVKRNHGEFSKTAVKGDGEKAKGAKGGKGSAAKASKANNNDDDNDDNDEGSGGRFAKPAATRGETVATKRVGEGKDSKLVMADGSPLPPHIEKIAGKIPPAWVDVRVATDPTVDVQATAFSVNEKTGKREAQSVYLPSFEARNAEIKFTRTADLMNNWHIVNEQVQNDRSDPKKAALADATWLMMEQGTRPGSEKDAKGTKRLFDKPVSTKNIVLGEPDKKTGVRPLSLEFDGQQIKIRDQGARDELLRRAENNEPLFDSNYWLKSHGATTLEGRHVVESKDGVRLQFMGKESVWHDHLIRDPALAQMLLDRKKNSGEDGKIFDTNEIKVRDYVATLDGGDFLTKDLRTARANFIAGQAVRETAEPKTWKDYKASVRSVAEKAAHVLGNRWQQCVDTYIDPAQWSSWRASLPPEPEKPAKKPKQAQELQAA